MDLSRAMYSGCSGNRHMRGVAALYCNGSVVVELPYNPKTERKNADLP
jgi:hypothetical protein